jgi:hypothetical protein
MADDELRQAIEALAAGKGFTARHSEALRAIMERVLKQKRRPSKDDIADALQDYCTWLLDDERSRTDLLSAPRGELKTYLHKNIERFLGEREKNEPVAKLRKALDTAIRNDPRFFVRGPLVGLHDTGEAIWPDSVWADDSDRVEHAALADAANAALAGVGRALSRRAIAVEILRHFVVLRDAVAIDSVSEDEHFHSSTSHDERVRRVRDGKAIAHKAIERLTQEELDLLAKELTKDDSRGRPNERLENVERKLREMAKEFQCSPLAMRELAGELARQGQDPSRPRERRRR